MEDEPELIRDQMQETRTALTEKIEALEQKVANTVQSTTSAVQETVDTVKDTVQATVDTVSHTVDKTVETVKDTFDIPGHVQRHPWAMVFGSLAAGFVLGRLIPSGREKPNQGETSSTTGQSWPEAIKQSSRERDDGAHADRQEEKKGPHEGIASSLLNALGGEVDKLKALGISAVFGVVRDLMTQSVPGELGSRLKEWVNGLTEKMGAKPFTEPILPRTEQDDKEEKEKAGDEMCSPQEQEPAKGAPSVKGQFNTGSPPRR